MDLFDAQPRPGAALPQRPTSHRKTASPATTAAAPVADPVTAPVVTTPYPGPQCRILTIADELLPALLRELRANGWRAEVQFQTDDGDPLPAVHHITRDPAARPLDKGPAKKKQSFLWRAAVSLFGHHERRVWHLGDPEPPGKPAVWDRFGRRFRYDRELKRYIHEDPTGGIDTGAGTWGELMEKNGPLTED